MSRASKYTPHQGNNETARRRAEVEKVTAEIRSLGPLFPALPDEQKRQLDMIAGLTPRKGGSGG